MSDPYGYDQRPRHPGEGGDPRRAQMNELLQQALHALNTGQASGATLTPETLTELAQRAGLPTGQLGDLSRSFGLGEAGERVQQHILFLLGDAECALPADAVQGVERIADITPVPNTVDWVLGVVQVWGSIVSVVDLRAFLGVPTAPLTSRSRLLVVTRAEMTIGLVVDTVTEMRPLSSFGPPQDYGTPPWMSAYAQGTLAVDGRQVTMLDPDRLLSAEAMHRYRADW